MVGLDFSFEELADRLAEDVVVGVEERTSPDVTQLRHLCRGWPVVAGLSEKA